MATFSGVGSKTPALGALGTAVDLGEPLTVFGALPPASVHAAFVTRCAGTLRRREVVNVNVSVAWSRYDFLPVDCSDVAQVVVVKKSDATGEYVCSTKTRTLIFVHLVLFII